MALRGRPKVLLIGNDDAKSSALEGILGDYTDLSIARNLEDGLKILAGGPNDAIFLGWSCHNTTWTKCMEAARRLDHGVPVLVFCHDGGRPERDLVRGAGVFDLLSAPYWERTVLSALERAITSRKGDALVRRRVGARQQF